MPFTRIGWPWRIGDKNILQKLDVKDRTHSGPAGVADRPHRRNASGV